MNHSNYNHRLDSQQHLMRLIFSTCLIHKHHPLKITLLHKQSSFFEYFMEQIIESTPASSPIIVYCIGKKELLFSFSFKDFSEKKKKINMTADSLLNIYGMQNPQMPHQCRNLQKVETANQWTINITQCFPHFTKISIQSLSLETKSHGKVNATTKISPNDA